MSLSSLSRRAVILGTACTFSWAVSRQAAGGPPVPPCHDLGTAPKIVLTPAESEAHRVFLLLAMTLVYDGWSINRQRPELVAEYAAAEPGRRFPPQGARASVHLCLSHL